MLQPSLLAHLEPKVVESGSLVVGFHARDGFLEGVGAEEHHRSEIEVVAQGSLLTVDDGGIGALAVGTYIVVVGVHHGGSGHAGYLHHALQGQIAHTDVLALEYQEQVGGFGLCGHEVQRMAVAER